MEIRSGTDPIDGLRLALLQQQQGRLRARLALRAFTPLDGLMALMLICGIVMVAAGGLGTADLMLRLGIGLLVLCQVAYLWFALRHATRKQLRKVEAQIEAETNGPDGAITIEAAAAAREFILQQRP